jgi:signal transduction histidine kinase
LLDPLNLTPHGFCLLWRPWLIWTDAISNVIIGVSYFSIPLALSVFARRRSDFLFLPAVWLFVAFIMLCGITHWLDVLTLWVPAYKVQAVFTAGTAAVSVVTAVASGMLLPKALGLPSHRQLHEAKVALIASARLAAFGQMAGGVAHEVNTPLAVIHGLASDLIDDCDATREEIVESAQRIVDYADRVTAIVRSLQNVARDGKKDPFYEAPVGEIVGQAMDV